MRCHYAWRFTLYNLTYECETVMATYYQITIKGHLDNHWSAWFAGGLSNQAIVDTLIIATSTVKKHINNIYGKLDVQSRTQALVRARELHLL